MIYTETLRDVLKITNHKKGLILAAFVSQVIFNFAWLLPPVATSQIINILTDGGDMSQIWLWAGLYLVFFAMYYFPRLWDWYVYRDLAAYYHIYIQKRLMEHVINNDAIFEEVSKGKIIATCTDDIRWVVDGVDCVAMMFSRVLRLLVIFVVFAVNNIWVAVAATLIDVVYFALMDKNSRQYAKYYNSSRKYEDRAADILNQEIANSRQIKAMNFMAPLNKKYEYVGSRWVQEYRKRRNARTRAFVTDPWIVHIGKIALYVFMGYLVIEGQMTIGVLVLLVSYYEQMVACTDEMRDTLVAISEYSVRIKRILKVLSFTQTSEVEYGELDNDYIAGLVEYQNVSYKNKGKWILRRVSFKAYPNEITAIVGPKGAGKTSLINLLFRLNRVTSGQILVDNENIYNYSKRAYQSNVSGVFEKPFVLEMTIRENLGLVDKNVKHQIAACKRVGLHDYIKDLPNGYDTVVSDDNFGSSEKQLLSVARALLSRAEILLFDGVQSEGVQEIPGLKNLLADLKQDHTIILVTHEEELKNMADRIVKMERGKVISCRKVKAKAKAKESKN